MMSTSNVLMLCMLLCVKSSIVVAIGFAIRALRGTFRIGDRALWMIVFASIALLPVLSVVLPIWDLPLFPVNHVFVEGNIPLGAAQISFMELVVIVWGAGAVLFLSSLLLDHIRAQRLIDRGERVGDKRLCALLAKARTAVGCFASPRIILTDELSTPALVGLRRPVLLLPRESRAWGDDQIFAVICHELFHLRKRDLVTNILERIVVALLWMNPLIHAARRYSAFAREVAADRAALRAGVPPELFARTMIDLARTGQADRAPAVALTFMNLEGTGFETRIKALFVAERHVAGRRSASLALVACFALTVAPVAIAQVIICVPEGASTVSHC